MLNCIILQLQWRMITPRLCVSALQKWKEVLFQSNENKKKTQNTIDDDKY